MARIIEITDPNAQKLDPFVRLTEQQLRSRRRPQDALFIAESAKVVGHALDAGVQPHSFLMEHRHIETQAKDVLARCPEDTPVYTGDFDTIEALIGYRPNRCILCAMHRPPERKAEELLAGARRVGVLEGIADPTNLGAIFRCAAALGMDALLLTPTCCDPLHRRAVRVSMGTVFQIPWARLGSSPADWPEKGLEVLKNAGFATASMALRPDSVPPDDPSLAKEEKLALILGTEGDGLAPATIAGCGHTIMIPMSAGVDSLNVAAAAAVAFWELGRKA